MPPYVFAVLGYDDKSMDRFVPYGTDDPTSQRQSVGNLERIPIGINGERRGKAGRDRRIHARNSRGKR